jgi:hypothetical protein
MIKPISQDECSQYLTEFFSAPAAAALAAELFRIEEEEEEENYVLGAQVCCEWVEFPSFQAAQAAVGGAYIPDGISFSGGFLMRK